MVAIPVLAMELCAGTPSYPQMQGTFSLTFTVRES